MKKRFALFLIGVLMCCIPVLNVFSAGVYLHDTAGLLSSSQQTALEEYAERISQQYEVGVYIVTIPSLSGTDAGETADYLYHEYYVFGEGSEKNGIMLMVSVEDRNYALVTSGSKADYAFTDYGLEQLEKEFLDDLKEDQWAAGFSDYLSACDRYLSLASENHPVNHPLWKIILMFAGLSGLISIAICLILRQQMKSVGMKRTAAVYSSGNLSLEKQSDRFINTTISRRKIERDDSRSGSSSGGGRVRTGKF